MIPFTLVTLQQLQLVVQMPYKVVQVAPKVVGEIWVAWICTGLPWSGVSIQLKFWILALLQHAHDPLTALPLPWTLLFNFCPSPVLPDPHCQPNRGLCGPTFPLAEWQGNYVGPFKIGSLFTALRYSALRYPIYKTLTVQYLCMSTQKETSFS